MFDVYNNAASGSGQMLRPLGAPWAFFRRLRVLAGNGQLVEDIDQYARVHQMFHNLVSKHSPINDSAEAFGLDSSTVKEYNDTTKLVGIAPQEAQTVMFKPLSGLFTQDKYIPLRYCPITIELELTDQITDPVVISGGAATNGFTTASTSTTWQLQQVQIKLDVCTLDNALDNSYAQHMLSGNALPINYSTWISQMQTIAGNQDLNVNITRALTRLKSVFVTLDKDIPTTGNRGVWWRRKWNDFFSPLSDNNYAGALPSLRDGEFDFGLQIGSTRFPIYPVRSHAEGYYQLKKCLGIQSSPVHSFDINGVEYRDYKFVLGIDTERMLEAGWTGLNTKTGSLLTVKFKYNSSNAIRLADRMHAVLVSDNILEIKDSGCSVYD